MAKIFQFVPALVALFLLLIVFTPNALALEDYLSADTLLSDDFNDGNLNGWTIEQGNWYVDPQKQLVGSATGLLESGSISKGDQWDNYRIEFDVRNFNGVDESIGFRKQDNNNNYEINLRHGSGEFDTPEIKLFKYEQGNLSMLADNKDVTLSHNVYYHINVEVVDEHIQAWINDQLVFDLNDAGTKVRTGKIFFSYWTGDAGVINVGIDNVKVTHLAKPRLPVIFIPGIGGSELQVSEDTPWSKDDGHGGVYTHLYQQGEKVWVNQDEALALGNDDYFDILKLKSDGQTPEANLKLTGYLSPYGYQDIVPFFKGIGYIEGVNFFVFNYDWRKDVRSSSVDLDKLIDQAKQKSGQTKVDIVAHSMGGLVARYYTSNPDNSKRVNKLIELGVPHLGSVDSIKGLLYGTFLGYDFHIIKLGIPSTEVKDLAQNLISLFDMLPSTNYFSMYNNSNMNNPYPIRDDRDIDNNRETGPLNLNQIKSLLSNLGVNMPLSNYATALHNSIDPLFQNPDKLLVYEIVGTNQPTLGQIHETWWITWPFKLFPKTEEVFINGDGVVPLYSASLKSDDLDLSGNAKLYYVDENHADLVQTNSTSMQTVKAILNEGDIPFKVKSSKIPLKGRQLSVDNGEIDLYDDLGNHTGKNAKGEMENNIPGTIIEDTGNSQTAFIKDTSKVKTTIKPKNTDEKLGPITVDLKLKDYNNDTISETTVYKDLPANKPINFNIDVDQNIKPIINIENKIYPPVSAVGGIDSSDMIPPLTIIDLFGPKDSSGNFIGPVIVTLKPTDAGSGVLKTEYSVDNGHNVNIYTSPFLINSLGLTTVQIISTDKAGNQESRSTVVNIIIPGVTSSPSPSPSIPPSPTPTPTPYPSTTYVDTTTESSNDQTSTTYTPTPLPSTTSLISPLISDSKDDSLVLGASYENPSSGSATLSKINSKIGEKIAQLAKETTNPKLLNINPNFFWIAIPVLETVLFGWLTFRFFKKIPKKMNN